MNQGRILVVDDTPQNVKLLADLLSVKGYQVSTAVNGEQALDKVAKEKPDLVLLDVMMPGIDGYETARRMRVLDPALPIVGQTAHALQEDHEQCLAAGMVDRLTKPIDTDDLVRAVLRHARTG